MRKEIILAITIGLIFGLIITFGIYFANRSTSSLRSSGQPQVTPTPTPQEDSLLTLDMPSDGDIFNTSLATLSGNVKDGVILILLTENNELFLNPKNNSFLQEIELTSGANLVQLTALSADGQRQEVSLNLVYTKAQLDSDK